MTFVAKMETPALAASAATVAAIAADDDNEEENLPKWNSEFTLTHKKLWWHPTDGFRG